MLYPHDNTAVHCIYILRKQKNQELALKSWIGLLQSAGNSLCGCMFHYCICAALSCNTKSTIIVFAILLFAYISLQHDWY